MTEKKAGRHGWSKSKRYPTHALRCWGRTRLNGRPPVSVLLVLFVSLVAPRFGWAGGVCAAGWVVRMTTTCVGVCSFRPFDDGSSGHALSRDGTERDDTRSRGQRCAPLLSGARGGSAYIVAELAVWVGSRPCFRCLCVARSRHCRVVLCVSTPCLPLNGVWLPPAARTVVMFQIEPNFTCL